MKYLLKVPLIQVKIAIIMCFVSALLLQMGCGDKPIVDCSERRFISKDLIDVLNPVMSMDSLIYQVKSSSKIDTVIYVKRDSFTDVLKFENVGTRTKECDIGADLFVERFHLTYFSEDNDSLVFDVTKGWSDIPYLFFHYSDFTMSEGYNSCFFCVTPDTTILINGVPNSDLHKLDGTVISNNSTFKLNRCMGYDGEIIATVEGFKGCRAYFDLSKGLLKWSVNESTDSLKSFELINGK